jgi:uracil-DNA glycosylase
MSRYFPNERISRIHGQPKKIGRRMVVPMYHPAAALHQGALRGAIEDDFDQLGKIIAKARAERDKEDAPDPDEEPNHEQMKLF